MVKAEAALQKRIDGIRKEAEKVKGGEDRVEEIIAAKLRDAGLSDSASAVKIPEHCVVNSRAHLRKYAGAATADLLAYYKRRDPAAGPTDRLITMLSMSNFHVRSVLLAERKADRGRAPVWMYSFDWETPAFGGRLKSSHSVEVPFVFDTLHVIGERHRKPGAQALADRVSKTWATFARNGDPTDNALPAWPAYTAARRATMVLDDECRVVDDPDGEVRPLWSKVATG